VWLRFAMGTGVLAFMILQRKQFALPGLKELPYWAFLGFIGVTFHHWAQATGLQTSQASTASWIISTTPVFIAIFGWLLLRERPGWLKAIGILLAALGVLWVVSRGDIAALFRGMALTRGDLLILTNPPNWALFTVLSRSGLRRQPPARMMLYVMGLGWLFTFPLFLGGPGLVDLSNLTAQGWLAAGFLGIICTGLGYIFWYDALEAMPAVQVGAFQYLQPLVTVIVAAALLGEGLSLSTILGGGMILLGVWLVQNRPRRSGGR
jgi:drug/metabolite transporter (DMT)-like permease